MISVDYMAGDPESLDRRAAIATVFSSSRVYNDLSSSQRISNIAKMR